MQLWPLAAPSAFATQTVISKPRLKVATATLAEGAKTPKHVHPHHDQLIHVVAGAVALQSTNNETRWLQSGQAVIIPAGVTHGLEAKEKTQLVTICLGDDGTEVRYLPRQPINAWLHNGLYYLQGSGIRLTYRLALAPTNQFGLFEEKIVLSDIDYIHPSVKDQPVATLPETRQSLLKRLAGLRIQKRSKVLAATYSRPNGLPSAP